ncbi:hypothetical protein EBR66_08725, partial [bacterium]|nr:hypothetical protein [bacterium]
MKKKTRKKRSARIFRKDGFEYGYVSKPSQMIGRMEPVFRPHWWAQKISDGTYQIFNTKKKMLDWIKEWDLIANPRQKRRSMREKRVMKIKRGLMKRAKKLHLGARRTGAYVYGTLRRIVGNPAGKQGWALVRGGGPTGMKMVVVSIHKTREGAETAMTKKGAIPDSQFTKGYSIHAFGPGTRYEYLDSEFTGKFLRPLVGNPIRSSFDKPTFGPFNTETRRVDTTTMAGMREAERLHRAGWYQGPVTLFSTTYYRKRALPKSSIARQIRRNPPMYAHGMMSHRTHGLSLKQMMKLYRMVSSGNP